MPILRSLVTLLLGFDPELAIPADAIPGQVPAALVVESEPIEGRVLRGDFEAPDRVLLVFTELWAGTTRTVAEHALASGAAVTFMLEAENPRWKMTRMVANLARRYADQITVLDGTVDTPWVRDWGPIQVAREGQPLWLDADYDDLERQQDDNTPVLLGRMFETEVVELPWSLDGGAFISNGAGLCVLTLEYLDEQGILWEADDLGSLLAQIGCRATALVPTLIGEETKHADMIAQFIGPNRLLMAEIDDELDGESEDALRLRAAERGILRAAATLGIRLEIIHVPSPPTRGQDNPRSYVNGLRLADRYLMPSYPELDERWDLAAWSAIQRALGDLPVVPIDTSTMIGSGGAIHCSALGMFTQ
ncbi:MAG: agmatine deiminase family protein [Enhygromyxa sp.]